MASQGLEDAGTITVLLIGLAWAGKFIKELTSSKQEAQSKNDSREKLSEMHKIITKDIKGTPIVYQPELDIQMRELINIREADHKRLGRMESHLEIIKDIIAKER